MLIYRHDKIGTENNDKIFSNFIVFNYLILITSNPMYMNIWKCIFRACNIFMAWSPGA